MNNRITAAGRAGALIAVACVVATLWGATAASAGPPSADLDLTKVVDDSTPPQGGTINYTITVTNSGPDDTSAVEVFDLVPLGQTLLVAAPSSGTYDSVTGIWAVPSLPAGTAETLTLTARVDGTGMMTNVAEVMESAVVDPDSVPGNGAPDEDDIAGALLSTPFGGACWLVADNGAPHTGGGDLLTVYDLSADVETVIDGGVSATDGTGTANVEAIAYDPIDGVLYAANASDFGWIDTATGEYFSIGAFGGTVTDVDGLTYDPATRTMWGAERDGADDRLVTIDVTTGAATVVAVIDLSQIRADLGLPDTWDDIDDLAVDPFTGTLYGGANGGGTADRLVIIDQVTGLATDVGPLTATDDMEGLGVDPSGQVRGTTGSGTVGMWDIDRNTGIAGNERLLTYGDYEAVDCGSGSNTIVGTVFEDLDGDGFADAGEPGTGGVTVNLYRDVDGDGLVGPADSLVNGLTTDGSGNYSFTVYSVGKFVLDIDVTTLPAGAALTTDNHEAADFGTAFSLTDAANDFGWVIPKDLTVTKVADPAGLVDPGDTIAYTIQVTNTSALVHESIVVLDPLPAGTTVTGSTQVVAPAGPSVDYADEFNAQGYAGSDGADPWTTSWAEIADDDDPTNGRVRVIQDGSFVPYGVRIADRNDGIVRLADTGGFTDTVFAFDVRRSEITDHELWAQVATSPAGPFTTVATITGLGGGTIETTDSVYVRHSVDVSAFAGPTMTVRFLTSNRSLNSSRNFWVDNVSILAYDRSPQVFPGGPPPVLVSAADGHDLLPGETMTVTYQVVVDDPATTATVDNRLEVTSDSQAEPSVAETTQPISSSVGDEVWLDLDGNGTRDPGEPPLAGVTVEIAGAGPDGIPGTADDVLQAAITDASGAYLFSGLAPDAYVVDVVDATLPGGVAATTPDPLAVPIVGGEVVDSADFGFRGDGSIGDLVWEDTDGDGTDGAGEPGIGGVDVSVVWAGLDGLFGTPDDVSFVATTDAAGSYLVGDLPAGQYRVEPVTATLPGFVLSTGNVPLTVGLGASENVIDADFGFYEPASVGDSVFEDLNGDGIEDPGDPGLAGVTVDLIDASTGATVATTTTDASGSYLFSGLAPGDYEVDVDETTTGLSSPVLTTGADPVAVTLVSGDADTSADFGFYEPASVGDSVFEDLNGDGTQDPGEPGLVGVTVDLIDASTGTTIATTTTDADGLYLFSGLAPGDYEVDVDETTTGLTSPVLTTGSDPVAVTLVSGEADTSADFGFYEPASVGDSVFEDLNGDGTQDPGEPGIAGVTVSLIDPGSGATIATTITDASGLYLFPGLAPGDYDVDVDESTVPLVDPVLTTGADPIAVNLVSGEADRSADFGFNQPTISAIGDTVFEDLNGDGVQDVGEPGIAGVTVDLIDPGTGSTLATTTTDAAGLYLFADLLAGDYLVDVDEATIGFAGPVLTTGADPIAVTLATGETVTTADFGFYEPASVGDSVFEDLNGNGIQGPADPGVAGVTVDLIDASTGATVATTTTDADGLYLFSGLAPGDYEVDVDETTTGLTAPVLTTGGDPILVTLQSGEADLSVDFGFYEPASVGDSVFEDRNGDGIQGPGDPGLAGVTVDLVDASTGTIIASTTTDADGLYLFTGLAPGDYEVDVDETTTGLTSPVLTTSGDPIAVTLRSGEADTSADFGFYEPGSVGDTVFEDLDDDGTQDPGEPGLAGVTVTATWAGPDATFGTADDVTFATATDPSGTYLFSGLAPGDYEVDVDETTTGLTSPVLTTAGDPIAVTLRSGDEVETVDFGFREAASVGDTVFEDRNGDGTQDPGDPGLAGVTVDLVDASTGTTIATTTTDADGLYLFPGLAPGDYEVDVDETTTGLTSPVLSTGGDPVAVTLVSGETDLSVDFGFYEPASVGDLVFEDLNGDGSRNPGEPGIAGATVDLWDLAVGTIVATTTTDASGSYLFSGLAPGDYEVDVDEGTIGLSAPVLTTSSDPIAVTLVSGQADTSADFGFYEPASVGDSVFEDLDADGVQGPGEPGLAGVTVDLVDASTGTIIATTTTDADGLYLFPGLAPGDYEVDVDETTTGLTSPVLSTGGDPLPVTLQSGEVDSSADFGFYEPASIGDTVFEDLDGDGTQVPGEPGLAGVTVRLIDATSGLTIGATATDATGTYTFPGLAPGDYEVDVDETTTGLTSPVLTTGADPIAVSVAAGDSVTSADFGFYEPASVGDLVWIDLDRNGAQDPGEPGLADVGVSLVQVSTGTTVSSTTTDADGLYRFDGVAPGVYEVVFAPVGFGFTTPDVAPDSLDSDADPATGAAPVTIGSGDADDTVDAGVEPASIGGEVWLDLDENGLNGGGEGGVPGVTVSLVDDATGSVLDTTTTDASGTYRFDVAPGSYRIEFTPVVGYAFSAQDVGSDDTIDSDADPATGLTEPIVVTAGPQISSIDAGLFPVTEVGDLVFEDVDLDGIFTTGVDRPLAGVTVNVWRTDATLAGSDTTNAAGAWDVTVEPGTYVVEFVAPAGFTFTIQDVGADDTIDSDPDPADGRVAVDVTDGVSDPTMDAGLWTDASVGDLVFHDLDGDGSRDPGEPGLAGVTVDVFDQGGALVGSAVTGAGGAYSVDVAPGQAYDVVIDPSTLPAGYALTTPGTVATPPLTSGQSFDGADFGAAVPSYDVSGTVWDDADVDQAIGGSESGLASVTVELLDAGGAVVATTATDGDGDFVFTSVVDGDYSVRVDEATVAAGMSSTTSNNPEPISVAGAAVAGVDFGYAGPGTVTVSKTPDLQTIVSGGTANFTIRVTNPGDQDLAAVTVSDALAPDCDQVVGALAAGDFVDISCSLSGVTADFTNTVVVDAVDELGNDLSDSDTADVDVDAPAIEIVKTPASQMLLSGGTASFDITVDNTGDVDLTDVVVTDPGYLQCDVTYATLAIGESRTHSCTVDDVTADFTNVASVVADDGFSGLAEDSGPAEVLVVSPAITVTKGPDGQFVRIGGTADFDITVENTGDTPLTDVVVTDPGYPQCDATYATLAVGETRTHSCSVDDVTVDFTNVVDVVADHGAGGTVTDSDLAPVDAIDPGVTIQKTPDVQQLLSGQTATFTITIANDGDVELTNVVVADAAAPDCDRTVASLAVGESISYPCTLAGVAADFTNVASVTADEPSGGTVSDDDDADVDVVDPSISVVKSPALQTLLSGESASFTITVTNDGEVPLTDVDLTDPLAPACEASWPNLAVGETQTVSCSLDDVTADLVNEASVSADHGFGGSVSDVDDAVVDVVFPGIEIQKTPDSQQLLAGGTATFTIVVSNSGDQDLVDIVVSDALAPDCDRTFASLAVGGSESYSCSMTVTEDLTNIVSAEADDVIGNTVSDSDDAAVDVIAPSVTIAKTPDDQAVLEGGTATFTITVTNDGDIDLASVDVSDPLAPDCTRSLGGLAVGESADFTCTLAGVTEPFTNTATVAAVDTTGNPVEASDTADVSIPPASISIEKIADTPTLVAGQDATFTITVTNGGGRDLLDVTVSDPDYPECDNAFATISAGAAESYSCTVSGITDDVTNVAAVTADDRDGGTYGDTDSATVDVVTPAVTIEKVADSSVVREGDDATFTITVTNSGETPLTAVDVADALVPACDRAIGDLAIGEVQTYSCVLAAAAADMTNVANVTGDDPAGGTVRDSDTAAVTVLPTGELTGFVFFDADGDGVFDAAAGDTPIGGVDVVISGAAPDITVTTAADGTFTATVEVGDVTVDVDETDADFPAGLVESTGTDGQTVSVSDTGTSVAADVGYTPEAVIEGTVWDDADADGLQGGSEAGLAGVEVELRDASGTVVATTVTDGLGGYRFDGLAGGDYSVHVVEPAGTAFTVEGAGSDESVDSDVDPADGESATVTVAPGEVADVDAGLYPLGSLTYTVWFDIDADANQGGGEPSLGGVDVVATWAGPDGVLGTADDVVTSATTDATGSVIFDDLAPGEYVVEVVAATLPAGLAQTADPDADLDSATSVSLPPGEDVDGGSFGYTGTGHIGDLVWMDDDGDGIVDPGESPAAGVTVRVTWAGLDGVLGTADDRTYLALTDALGHYGVDGLPAGDYLVEVDPDTTPDGAFVPLPLAVELGEGESRDDVDIPLVMEPPLVPVDDEDTTMEDTPVVVPVLDNDLVGEPLVPVVTEVSDPDNGTAVINPDGTITYTPDPGFHGTDTFTYTLCPAPGFTTPCDTAVVTIVVVPVNEPPDLHPEQPIEIEVRVGSGVDSLRLVDPEDDNVTVELLSGTLPPGLTLEADGSFSGTATETGTYRFRVRLCDDGVPQACTERTLTITVTASPPPPLLAFTGASSLVLASAGIMLLVVGAGVTLASRRRAAAG